MILAVQKSYYAATSKLIALEPDIAYHMTPPYLADDYRAAVQPGNGLSLQSQIGADEMLVKNSADIGHTHHHEQVSRKQLLGDGTKRPKAKTQTQ